MYMLKMMVRLVLLALLVLVFSYLWQWLAPHWTQETSFDFTGAIKDDNFTLLEQVQSVVEKETSAAVNPYLSSGVQS